MKAKYIFIYAGLAVAFAAVCAWVFISGGRNSKAVNAKFRLGGLMLTVAGLLSLTACGRVGGMTCYDPQPTCYDVAIVANEITISNGDPSTEVLQAGDKLNIEIAYPTFDTYNYVIREDNEGKNVIQSGQVLLEKSEESGNLIGNIVIGKASFTGKICLEIYGHSELEGEEDTLLSVSAFILQ